MWPAYWPNYGPLIDSQKPKCGQLIDPTAYIYVVKLKIGPIFAFLKVKNWSKFFVFENLVLPAERRIFKETHTHNCLS